MAFENSIWREYHESSRDFSKGHPNIPFDSNEWPEDWKQVEYKSYARLPTLSLPEPQLIERPLGATMRKRSSHRSFTGAPLALGSLSDMLYAACAAKEGSDLRPYPSGGALYPIEVYLLNLSGTATFPGGVYHYDFKDHALNVLWKRALDDEIRTKMFRYPWARKASVAVIMTSVFKRTMQKYGERGYRFILLEAGHIGQNIALAAQGCDVKCCVLGGINESYVETFLNLDPKQESVVYSAVLGS